MKITIIRRITLVVAILAVVIGLLLNAGTGSFSSFGWQAIAAICPLGTLESFLASRTIFPRALIVLGMTVVFVLVFGKAFCSWLCPMVPLRSLFRLKTWKGLLKSKTRGGGKGEVVAAVCAAESDSADVGTLASAIEPASAVAAALALAVDESAVASTPADALAHTSCKGCSSSCASKRAKLDARHLVLGGSLLSAAIFGFPVFCLVCPIGLTFGTIVILWHLVGFGTFSLSLLLYPAILLLELLVIRKWCLKFCPLGALLSLISLPNRLFRPKVSKTKCLRENGADCSVCCEVCPEELDPHFAHDMHECSKCGLCVDKCPASAITIPLKARDTVN